MLGRRISLAIYSETRGPPLAEHVLTVSNGSEGLTRIGVEELTTL
jgi:hypothetical protein